MSKPTSSRGQRLQKVLQRYLPPTWPRGQFPQEVLSKEAWAPFYETDMFAAKGIGSTADGHEVSYDALISKAEFKYAFGKDLRQADAPQKHPSSFANFVQLGKNPKPQSPRDDSIKKKPAQQKQKQRQKSRPKRAKRAAALAPRVEDDPAVAAKMCFLFAAGCLLALVS